jgi:sterol 3beta-glucosyltransferase
MGARKNGVTGFVVGIGKGFGGLVFKTCAAGLSLPAYTLKGVEKQFEKRHNRPLVAKLLAIRIRQSLASFENVTQQEKDDVIARWKEQGFDKGSFVNVK